MHITLNYVNYYRNKEERISRDWKEGTKIFQPRKKQSNLPSSTRNFTNSVSFVLSFFQRATWFLPCSAKNVGRWLNVKLEFYSWSWRRGGQRSRLNLSQPVSFCENVSLLDHRLRGSCVNWKMNICCLVNFFNL